MYPDKDCVKCFISHHICHINQFILKAEKEFTSITIPSRIKTDIKDTNKLFEFIKGNAMLHQELSLPLLTNLILKFLPANSQRESGLKYRSR